MYQLIDYTIAYPNYEVQLLVQATNGQPNLFNSSYLLEIPLFLLPSGGVYEFQVNTKTFLQIQLGSFTISPASNLFAYGPGNYSPPPLGNMQNFDMVLPGTNSWNINQVATVSENTNGQTGINGYQASQNIVETVYLYGDSFVIDTTSLAKSQFVLINLPTYLQLEATGQYTANVYGSPTTVEYIVPTTTFYFYQYVLQDNNLNVYTPFGVEYGSQIYMSSGNVPQSNSGEPPFVAGTVASEVPDLYGNIPEFLINGSSVSNSLYNPLGVVDEIYVPQSPSSYFSYVGSLPATLDGQYNYGSFTTLGQANGIDANGYTVFIPQVFDLNYVETSYINNIAYLNPVGFWYYGVYAGKFGIKPYLLMIGMVGNSFGSVYAYTDPGYNIVNSSSTTPPNISQTLQSNGYILPTIIRSTTSYMTGVSTLSTGASVVTSTTSTSTTTTSTTTPSTTTTTPSTTTSVTKYNIINILTSPLVVAILLLALVGVILFAYL